MNSGTCYDTDQGVLGFSNRLGTIMQNTLGFIYKDCAIGTMLLWLFSRTLQSDEKKPLISTDRPKRNKKKRTRVGLTPQVLAI